jgi:two-component system, LytTR family, response regulator
MKLKYIIIDDEPLAQRIIERYAEKIPTLDFMGKCNNAFDGIDMVMQMKPDLIFLDINMPNMSGMDFLRTLSNPPIIIITTAYREYALESYEFDVTDYLKKPFSFERFHKAIQKALNKIDSSKSGLVGTYDEHQTEDHFFVKADKMLIKIAFDDVVYVEAYGDYIKIHRSNDMVLVLMSLKRIMEQLPSNQFIRVHKSFIIANSFIDKVEGNIIYLGDKEIPVGKSFRQEFFRKIKPK